MLAESPTFPKVLRDLRRARGLTQRQLARELDVTLNTINGWENGRHVPIRALAKQVTRMARTAGVIDLDADISDAPPRDAASIAGEAVVRDGWNLAKHGNWGWPRSAQERRDFYHRIREFPVEVNAWRKQLVDAMADDRRFPTVNASTSVDRRRSIVDMEASRLREIQEILHLVHGTPTLGNHRDPVDELVYIILARRTPEAKYQSTFRALKARFPDWASLLRARLSTVQKIVSTGGLGEKKTLSIVGALKTLEERFGCCSLQGAKALSDQELEEFLCGLPEVGRKSAYCIMMYSFDRRVFPVDAHVGRVLMRLGIFGAAGFDLEGTDHKEKQKRLADLVPPALRLPLHVNLLAHGRDTCTAKKPKCDDCELARFCRTYRKERIAVASQSDAPATVDLFCGAGGLTEGFRRAGFSTAMVSDQSEVALRTLALNHPNIALEDIVCDDIENLTASDIRKRLGRRRLDVLAGAPPCQGYSTVGHRSKITRNRKDSHLKLKDRKEIHDDGRNDLYEHFVRLAADLKPRLVLFENVPGMDSARVQQKSPIQKVEQLLHDAGYVTAVWRLDATMFGVPQTRNRLFVVGSRGKSLPAMPEASFSAISGSQQDRYAPRPIGLGHAIFDLPAIAANEGAATMPWPDVHLDEKRARHFVNLFGMRTSPRVLFNHTVRYHNDDDLELYALLEQGEDSTHAIEEHGARGRQLMKYRTDAFDDKYMRLDEDEPCRTIVSHLAKDGNGYIHPTQVRSLSFREAARVQTFHDGYAFCGSPSDQWIQLGNAVPPVVGEAIGMSFLTHLQRNS